MLRMAASPRRSIRITITLAAEDRDRLDRLAQAEDRTLSGMASHAVRVYLRELGEGSDSSQKLDKDGA
jgi:predicted transcriptional regulator